MPSPTSTQIDKAVQAIKNGDLVAFATETVYGLGADACNGEAVARIFEAKGRPRFNPLIIHVASVDDAMQFGVFNDPAQTLAAQFWPGALTLVVPLKPENGISELVTAGLSTIAIRVPSHSVAQNFLREVGGPLAAPSANKSGSVSPTTAAHVAADLGRDVAVILDGGAASLGLESTIVDLTGDTARVLRPGSIARDEIEACLGAPVAIATQFDSAKPSAPGQLASHYAPNANVRLNAAQVHSGEALLAFGPELPPHDGPVFNLSPTGNVREAAAHLFAALRSLDASGAQSIAVMTIPDTGLGEAINDRLQRAAAPRI